MAVPSDSLLLALGRGSLSSEPQARGSTWLRSGGTYLWKEGVSSLHGRSGFTCVCYYDRPALGTEHPEGMTGKVPALTELTGSSGKPDTRQFKT